MKNPKYKDVDPPDPRVAYVPIACGKCKECRKMKAKEWRMRLSIELQKNEKCYFVTLTFSEEYLDKLITDSPNDTAAVAISKFRKLWYNKYKTGIKHWLITELGHEGTERVHLHGIIWCNQTPEEINKQWKCGIVDFGDYVNEKTINYIVKYVTKVDEDHPGFMGKIFASKGLGRDYINEFNLKKHKYKKTNTKEYFRTEKGFKIGLPMYMRKKLWTDEEREKLWIEKINQKIRFVNGEKIDISTEEGMREYWLCLEYHQRETERVGYPKEPWTKKKYKNRLNNINKIPNIADTTNEQKNIDEWKA